MFQKKQIIYSETLGVCQVENIVQLTVVKDAPTVAYYVLKPLFSKEKASYIPVENHQVALREIFSVEEAEELKQNEAYKKDEKIKAAVDYVLGSEEEQEEQDGAAGDT